MPSLRIVSVVPASGSIVNILAGSKFEFTAAPSVVSFYAVADGATMVASDPTAVLTFGNVIEADQMAVPVFGAGLGPDRNQHLLAEGVADAGDRLVIQLNNADAVTLINVRSLIVINQL